jgi:hypothetical protein
VQEAAETGAGVETVPTRSADAIKIPAKAMESVYRFME